MSTEVQSVPTALVPITSPERKKCEAYPVHHINKSLNVVPTEFTHRLDLILPRENYLN